jgi:chaperonin GroEL
MVAKKLLVRSEARERILAAAMPLADAIRVPLGPESKSVLIHRRRRGRVVCNDGVTIARETEQEDPAEDLGARMLREAAA